MAFSTRLTHAAQVMPMTVSPRSAGASVRPGSAGGCETEGAELVMKDPLSASFTQTGPNHYRRPERREAVAL
jgi:hypothetical protein